MFRTISTALFTALATAAFGQQAIFDQQHVTSPLPAPDGSITFSLYAPEAKEVRITGDFLPRQIVNTPTGSWETDGQAALTRGESGLWTYTTTRLLDPELYMYKYIVDGVDVLDPANIHRTRDVRTHMSNFIVTRQAGDRGDIYGAHADRAHGDIHQLWYSSPTLSTTRRLTVYTPAGYSQSKQKYPVLYLLHGMGGDETAWIELGRTAQILDNLIATGKCQPMIVVMTNGHAENNAAPGINGPLTLVEAGITDPAQVPSRTTPHLEPRAVNSNGRGNLFPESFPDVMKFVEKQFRVKTGYDNTAICGLSMGGFHSMTISQLFPKKFGYVGLFSAAISMAPDRNQISTYDYLLGEKSIRKNLEKQFNRKPHLYWIGIGKTDFLYDQNKDYRRYLDERGYPYEYYETDGGHIWRNWRIYLTEFSQKIFK